MVPKNILYVIHIGIAVSLGGRIKVILDPFCTTPSISLPPVPPSSPSHRPPRVPISDFFLRTATDLRRVNLTCTVALCVSFHFPADLLPLICQMLVSSFYIIIIIIDLTYLALHEVTWCMVVWCTQNAPRRQQFHVAPAMPAL